MPESFKERQEKDLKWISGFCRLSAFLFLLTCIYELSPLSSFEAEKVIGENRAGFLYLMELLALAISVKPLLVAGIDKVRGK